MSDTPTTAIQPSASPALRADRNARRLPSNVQVRERRSDDARDRDVFLGLMLFLGTQRHPQAP